MTSLALKTLPTTIDRADPATSILAVTARDAIAVKAGTVLTIDGVVHTFEEETPIDIVDPAPGRDYGVFLAANGKLHADVCDAEMLNVGIVAGFHFAPGGNATERSGGDSVPAINPFSCWDLNFRPACPDARGMALIDMPDGTKVWVDIYKLNINHLSGTSRFGVTIADGVDLPLRIDSQGHYGALDYKTAVEIYAHHGKQPLSYDEFRVAALGVTEKTSADRDPKVTGLDAARTSQRGIMQATGNLWDWGHDGDPDTRRASIFGGSWWNGGNAGSRYADLGTWPGRSDEFIGARGRSDHLTLV